MSQSTARPTSLGARLLDIVERVGNKLPDPALLFVYAMLLVWIVSALLDGHSFELPSKEGAVAKAVQSQLSGTAIVEFLADMVKTFTSFHPLGVVLVALLGVGVAEHSGFINAGLKGLLSFTPRMLLTPMLIFAAIISHTAADAGYVLVIPLGGIIFYAAGRHPLAGIAAAFAGVSGGFSANPVPSSLDPLLAGLTQTGVDILDPSYAVNPLGNWYFTAASTVLIILLGWYLTDRVIEPRLRKVEIDGDKADMPSLEPMTPPERRGMWAGITAMGIGLVVYVIALLPSGSPMRGASGSITSADSGAMRSIVPIIFLLFLIPGVVHGFVAGTFKSHRDVVKAMAKSMSTMGYYLVMAFFAALFIYSFNKSNLGALIAVQGASALKSAALPAPVTIVGIILLTAMVNLLIGSASAKWALLAPIFVPMLMQLGISPELTQGAYRVGDSTTNIITPLMPYFPLVVAFSQRYVKNTGIGTLAATMLPYTLVFLTMWTLFLLAFWGLGIPLGIDAGYVYPANR
ncbi:MAG: AbgT family transporter [Deltaproteobacteria bacterium]|nr:AbgT family transporter [Deltaproteobacteria bacterium]